MSVSVGALGPISFPNISCHRPDMLGTQTLRNG